MESIRQAVDLARAGSSALQGNSSTNFLGMSVGSAPTGIDAVELNSAELISRRIVAHSPLSEYGRSFDMLRTQVLQEIEKNDWQVIAITSPTAGCGKSVTACNLAISIARLPEKAALLIDMDLHKPKVAEYLGLGRKDGIVSVLEGRATLPSKMVEAVVARNRFLVLPGEACRTGASEWMASQTMATLLQTIRRDFRSRVVLLDLPPMLLTDDVISMLPLVDAVLLVASVGATSLAEIKECHKHLKSTPVVRVVVNKVTEPTDSYYGYY